MMSRIDKVYDLYIVREYLGGSGEASSIGNSYQSDLKNKFCVIAGYDTYLKPGCRDWSLQYQAQTLNHEIGHSLGLFHTWSGDGLDDTPDGKLYHVYPGCTFTRNANCWGYVAQKPSESCIDYPCNDWANISNNMMDYNGNFPHAVTSKQLKEVHDNLNSTDGSTYVYECNTAMPAIAFFEISSDYNLCNTINTNKVYINPQGTFNEDEFLIEICELDQNNNCFNSYSSGWIQGKINNKKRF